MPEFTYHIPTLFTVAFGAVYKNAIRYKGIPDEQSAVELDFGNTPTYEIPEAEAHSYLGTPIFFPMSFSAGDYQVYNGFDLVTQGFNRLAVSPATTADFRRSKIINRTKISGGKGNVKEQYGWEDWNIRIEGLLLSENPNEYPEAKVEELKKWEEIADSIAIEGKMFELLGIHRVAIVDIDFPDMKGYPGVQPFRLYCESDEPQELIL